MWNTSCEDEEGGPSSHSDSRKPLKDITSILHTTPTMGNKCNVLHCKQTPKSAQETFSTPKNFSRNFQDLHSTPIRNLVTKPLYCTPKNKRRVSKKNPFDEGLMERLNQSVWSPSVFSTIVSPSKEEASTFQWSIDQLSVLHPASIDEIPFDQGDSPTDPNTESVYQKAIEKYFQSAVVPSPWERPSQSVMDVSFNINSSYSEATASTAKYENIAFATGAQSTINEVDEGSCDSAASQSDGSMNVSSLRRKLFFQEDEIALSPVSNKSPICCVQQIGGFISTPASDRCTSSPISANFRRTSLTPPEHVISPPISPISKSTPSTKIRKRLSLFKRSGNETDKSKSSLEDTCSNYMDLSLTNLSSNTAEMPSVSLNQDNSMSCYLSSNQDTGYQSIGVTQDWTSAHCNKSETTNSRIQMFAVDMNSFVL